MTQNTQQKNFPKRSLGNTWPGNGIRVFSFNKIEFTNKHKATDLYTNAIMRQLTSEHILVNNFSVRHISKSRNISQYSSKA